MIKKVKSESTHSPHRIRITNKRRKTLSEHQKEFLKQQRKYKTIKELSLALGVSKYLIKK